MDYRDQGPATTGRAYVETSWISITVAEDIGPRNHQPCLRRLIITGTKNRSCLMACDASHRAPIPRSYADLGHNIYCVSNRVIEKIGRLIANHGDQAPLTMFPWLFKEGTTRLRRKIWTFQNATRLYSFSFYHAMMLFVFLPQTTHVFLFLP